MKSKYKIVSLIIVVLIATMAGNAVATDYYGKEFEVVKSTQKVKIYNKTAVSGDTVYAETDSDSGSMSTSRKNNSIDLGKLDEGTRIKIYTEDAGTDYYVYSQGSESNYMWYIEFSNGVNLRINNVKIVDPIDDSAGDVVEPLYATIQKEGFYRILPTVEATGTANVEVNGQVIGDFDVSATDVEFDIGYLYVGDQVRVAVNVDGENIEGTSLDWIDYQSWKVMYGYPEYSYELTLYLYDPPIEPTWNMSWYEGGLFNNTFGQNPFGLAVDGTRVYMSDTSNNAIKVFDYNGNFNDEWYNAGQGVDYTFNRPKGIDIDSQGRVYIADYGSGSVIRMTSDGTYIDALPRFSPEYISLGNVSDIAIDDFDNIYVPAYDLSYMNLGYRVLKFDSNWKLLDTIYITVWGNRGIDVDSNGNLYVSSGHGVYKYAPDGTLLMQWGGDRGTAQGQFDNPGQPFVDPEGYLHIPDAHNQRIQVFDPNGNFFLEWGMYGSADGDFITPSVMFIDGSNVFVLDVRNVADLPNATGSGNAGYLQKFEKH